MTIRTNGGGVHGHAPRESDVCVVGAGPAGLMLGTLLARFGIKTQIVDERPGPTTAGRADGIQPKTIETLQMLGLGDELLRDGVRVHDVCMWRVSEADNEPLHRVAREIHYPADALDVRHPFILLCHQGMIEDMLVKDLVDSGVEICRGHRFESFKEGNQNSLSIETSSSINEAGSTETFISKYLVGCDGARSKVREAIPDTYAQGTPHRSVWGVLDGELDTDFPDIWSKTIVHSHEYGTILIIPRERNMTRFYIEMKESQTSKGLAQELIMDQARQILAPYRLEWRTVEWFGNYQVAQRVAARFSDPSQRAFVAGDASHTHSPKAAQGMNTSVHDSWNLAWKLNLAVRGLAKPGVLLGTYEEERKKIAHDLINFDYEHANSIAGGDAETLAANFRTNIGFIAGTGVEYSASVLNQDSEAFSTAAAKSGCTLPPARATRYIDACPVDLQVDIPVLGQFRIYVMVPNVIGQAEGQFLDTLSKAVLDPSSMISRASTAASKSLAGQPRPVRPKDVHVRPERYTTVSELFTFALVTSTNKNEFEIADLPTIFSQSSWTVYLDDVAASDTRQQTASEKWFGAPQDGEVIILNVRPDGFVGSMQRWKAGVADGAAAAKWLEDYYGGFLQG